VTPAPRVSCSFRCESVARDADDLYRIAGQILDLDGVEKTTTGLVMRASWTTGSVRCWSSADPSRLNETAGPAHGAGLG